MLIILPLACAGCVGGVEPAKPTGGQELLEDSTRSTPASSNDSRFSRNMVNTVDKHIPAEWSIQEGAQKNIKWSAKIGTMRTGYLPPAIAGGKVFIASNNTDPRDPNINGDKAILKCFRESDGQFLWQIVHDMPPVEVQQKQADKDGLLSTPFVEGDRLYYVTPAAVVVCAGTDGKVVWQYDMMKELKVFPCFASMCSPLVADGLVFVVTGNGTDSDQKLPSPDAPSFAAIDSKTGELKWSCNLPGANVMEGQWSHPAYAVVNSKPQAIFPGGDGWLYGLDAKTGNLVWKFDCNPKVAKPGSKGRNYLVSAPVIYDNKAYIGVGQRPDSGTAVGHFWCIDITKTGDISPVNDNWDPKADVNKNSGLVWHYGGLIMPEPKRGRRDVFGRTVSTAAIHDGLVYISELMGVIHCLDAKTGQKYWDYDMLSEIWGSPYLVDGKIFIGADNGEIAVLSPGKTPPKKEAVKKIDVERAVKAPLVAANGTLYVVTETHLYAIAGK
jgi:outer membrane protein assembly factor BamB